MFVIPSVFIEKVQNWVKELRRILGDKVVLAIVGNKIDLDKERNKIFFKLHFSFFMIYLFLQLVKFWAFSFYFSEISSSTPVNYLVRLIMMFRIHIWIWGWVKRVGLNLIGNILIWFMDFLFSLIFSFYLRLNYFLNLWLF